MAIYPIECEDCGRHDDVFQPMEERTPGAPYPFCGYCGSPSTRRRNYSVVVHGADTERAPGTEWSQALSTTDEPVYVKDRAEWKRLMKLRGVVPVEDGQLQSQREAREARIEEKTRKDIDESIDSALRVWGESGGAGVRNVLQDQGVQEKMTEGAPPWESPTE